MAKKRKSIHEIFAEIDEHMKDPKFRKAVKAFIAYHTGKSPR